MATSYKSPKERAGIKVIRSKATKKRAIIGMACLAISMTDTSVSELATKRLTPIGGVTKPMARLTTMITPNWIGSMPIASMIGKSIGVRIKMAGVVSITIPTISKNKLITRSIITGLLKLFKIKALTVCGTCIRVSTREKAVDAARIKRIGVKVLMASIMIAQISLICILLYTNMLTMRA